MPFISIDDELRSLSELSRRELRESWRTFNGSDPPKGISRHLMVRAVAYEMQARRHGRLKTSTRRRLKRIARNGGDCQTVCRASKPQPGARLIREWNGEIHIVDVTDAGFDWRERRYGSLSEIAREITGARWSGPRFFGLNGRVAP